jgi:hypothetical protein
MSFNAFSQINDVRKQTNCSLPTSLYNHQKEGFGTNEEKCNKKMLNDKY